MSSVLFPQNRYLLNFEDVNSFKMSMSSCALAKYFSTMSEFFPCPCFTGAIVEDILANEAGNHKPTNWECDFF